TYLPAFKALVDANVEGFMGAYNRTNGEPCCGSKTLLKDLLRDKWGFDGYVTSDCGAISDFHLHHKITNVPTESVALALKNGCDLNCGNMYGYLLAALKEGLITEDMIRKSTIRLMKTRMKLGMFDKKTPFDDITYDVVDCEEHRRLNYEVACRAMVLLKNNGILPLDKTKLKNVAVIGPNANSISALEGNYHGTANQYHTVLESIREALPGARVNYSQGSHLYEYKIEDTGFSEARTQAEMADVVVLVVGLDETIEGEEMADKNFTGDKKDLLLPECQRDLIKAVCDSKTPVIIVNMSGSAIDFGYGNEHAAAIIQAWYPGAMGGKAVSDLIFGEYSPSGRLPVTFYRNDNNLPDFEDYSMDGRTYKFIKGKPLFPFGYGLSYTRFEYSNMKTDKNIINPGDPAKCFVNVKNTGKFQGEEIVELYIRDEEASFRVPHHKLCGTNRISLNAGEEKTVEFTVEPKDMCVIDDDGNYVYEGGRFTLFAGGHQPDGYSKDLTGTNCVSVEFQMR
ncbi:MAG TPA: glycosyl hydrolase, partial [Clostridiaceae bacterium]|nr:glycosyl hydrolase [Clostridiaceae bacterium]